MNSNFRLHKLIEIKFMHVLLFVAALVEAILIGNVKRRTHFYRTFAGKFNEKKSLLKWSSD